MHEVPTFIFASLARNCRFTIANGEDVGNWREACLLILIFRSEINLQILKMRTTQPNDSHRNSEF